MGACRVMRVVAYGHRAEIGPFYVTPAWQERGARDALMGAMVDHAREGGAWQLELHVADDNPRAQRFYARDSFRKVGRLRNAALVNRVMTSDIFMVADLR